MTNRGTNPHLPANTCRAAAADAELFSPDISRYCTILYQFSCFGMLKSPFLLHRPVVCVQNKASVGVWCSWLFVRHGAAAISGWQLGRVAVCVVLSRGAGSFLRALLTSRGCRAVCVSGPAGHADQGPKNTQTLQQSPATNAQHSVSSVLNATIFRTSRDS